MGQRLKYRETIIVRAIAFAAQGGKSQAVRRAIGKIADRVIVLGPVGFAAVIQMDVRQIKKN